MNNAAIKKVPAATTAHTITDKEFKLFQSLIYDKAGISMSDAKKFLMVTRLSKRLRHFKLNSFTQYHQILMNGQHRGEMQNMIDLLTTNETYFFREEKHFDFLQKEILANHRAGKRFRVWSAACSRGQEPYTLAMVLADQLGVDANWDILATDISSKVLDFAHKGLYPINEADKIPKDLLNKWCFKGVRSQMGSLLIDKRLGKHISFKSLNLIGQWPDTERFSVIFLRNVMIYFDIETKQKLVERLRNRLELGGYLIVGHSESLNQVNDKMKVIQPSVYQRID